MATILPNGVTQFFDGNGNPLAGGSVTFYVPGTTTPKDTWQDPDGDILNTNPVVLDQSGEAIIYGSGSYRQIVKDADGNLIWDQLTADTAVGGLLWGGTSTGLPNAQVISVSGFTERDGQEISFIAGLTNTGPTTIAPGDLPGIAVLINTENGPTALPAGAIVAGNAYTLIYDASRGAFHINAISPSIVGVSGANFGMVSDLGTGNTNNATAFQNAINYCIANKQTLYLFGRYRVNGEININGAFSMVLVQGAELNFAGLGVNKTALKCLADNVVISGAGTLSGPSVATLVAGERAISMIGTDTTDRLSGLTVTGIEIKDFGSDGIYGQFVDNIYISRCRIHDVGFQGAVFLSCNYGRATDNDFYSITPGSGGNMYGLILTQDSTGYNTDPNRITAPKETVNPFCWDWVVSRNNVWDINWEGLDCHGAYEITMEGNRIYATRKGLSVPSSSGDALNYAGWSNIVINNIIDARNRDGSVSGYENLDAGITVNGGTVVSNNRVVVAGNILVYKGILNNTNSGAIEAKYVTNLACYGNVIDYWGGAGVHVGASGGVVSANQFGRVSGSSSDNVCVRDNIGTTLQLSVTGNQLDPGSGNAANFGFSQGGSAPTYRVELSGNNFARAGTAPFSLGVAGFTIGTDVVPVVTPADADIVSAGNLILTGLNGSRCLVILTSSSSYNITTFTGAIEGQVITIYNTGSGTATITRADAKLDGSTNKALAPGGTITLQRYGGDMIQIAPVLTVG